MPEAERDLARLDRGVGKRVVAQLRWLAENCDEVRHLPLSRDLARLYKRRVGRWRVVYELVEEEKTLLVHLVDHRSVVYDEARKKRR